MDEDPLTMNVYIFTESDRASVYGIGTYIRELTGALRHSPVNLCVVHLKSDRHRIQIEETGGVGHWYFPMSIRKPQKTDNKDIDDLYYRNIAYLLRLFIEDKKDLIFHLNYNQNSPLAEELKKKFNCRIVTTIHYLDWCLRLSGNVGYFRKILLTLETYHNYMSKKLIVNSYQSEKKLFEKSDHILCLTNYTRQILQNDYQLIPAKITVIPNGLTDSIPISDKQTIRKKYHTPDIPIILFVGRMDEIKGLAYALRAFKIVLEKQLCHFIIAGSGDFNVHLKECEDIWMHVTWTGLINKDKLYDLYSIADIGIMPSFHEQCSYVAIEMMMHGLPIIGSTTTGLKEMIVDNETGLHIPVIEHDDRVEIDSSLLATKMQYLLQNPEERKRLGVNARKRYEDNYSSEIFRKNMLNFYNSLL